MPHQLQRRCDDREHVRMTSFFESIPGRLLRRSAYGVLHGADHAFPRRRDKLVIFSYHSIASDEWRFSVDPDVFRLQIDDLLSRYRPLSLSETVAVLRGELTIDTPSFALTFDDGYRDVLFQEPFLSERGIRPAFFVLSDSERSDRRELGTHREHLSFDDMRILISLGWEIGCHSATHGDFWTMDAERLRAETQGAKMTLERALDVPVRFFAYPRGRYTDEAKRAVREAGYEAALSMDDGLLSSKTDLFAIPRIGVDRTHTLAEFRTIHGDASIVFRKQAKRFLGKFL